MSDTENVIEPYISKYSGEEIDMVLEKAEELYKMFYESAPDELLYFLVSKNNNPQWDAIPYVEGVEI